MNREDVEAIRRQLKLHFIKNNFIKDAKAEAEASKLEQRSLFSRVVELAQGIEIEYLFIEAMGLSFVTQWSVAFIVLCQAK